MAAVSAVDVGVLFLIAVTASLANGSSSSKDVSQRTEAEAIRRSSALLPRDASEPELKPCAACGLPGARRRPKRCTCYTYKDKECVYYCHLDIIWINTPENTVPYGMSSYQGSLRTRRSAGTEQGKRARARRCECTRESDAGCSSFCMDSSQRKPHQPLAEKNERTVIVHSQPEMNREP